MGRVICVANQKGGVGKTTTAVNLSASLAVAEKKCLLIDCDPQGNATTGLGMSREEQERGLYDLILGTATDGEVISRTALGGLDFIGATMDLVGAEVEIASV